jgi:hypothetical protein
MGAPKGLASTRAAFGQPRARTDTNGGRLMQNTPNPLRPAQAEVHRTAHDQDLIEVPKRARLDREAEGKTFQPHAITKSPTA